MKIEKITTYKNLFTNEEYGTVAEAKKSLLKQHIAQIVEDNQEYIIDIFALCITKKNKELENLISQLALKYIKKIERERKICWTASNGAIFENYEEVYHSVKNSLTKEDILLGLFNTSYDYIAQCIFEKTFNTLTNKITERAIKEVISRNFKEIYVDL